MTDIDIHSSTVTLYINRFVLKQKKVWSTQSLCTIGKLNLHLILSHMETQFGSSLVDNLRNLVVTGELISLWTMLPFAKLSSTLFHYCSFILRDFLWFTHNIYKVGCYRFVPCQKGLNLLHLLIIKFYLNILLCKLTMMV